MALGVDLDVRSLPLREEILDLITSVRSKDRRVVLATAADDIWARQIASELGIFDDVLASDGARTLKGQAKLDAIRESCDRNGFAAFDYAGDRYADLPVWSCPQRA